MALNYLHSYTFKKTIPLSSTVYLLLRNSISASGLKCIAGPIEEKTARGPVPAEVCCVQVFFSTSISGSFSIVFIAMSPFGLGLTIYTAGLQKISTTIQGDVGTRAGDCITEMLFRSCRVSTMTVLPSSVKMCTVSVVLYMLFSYNGW